MRKNDNFNDSEANNNRLEQKKMSIKLLDNKK